MDERARKIIESEKDPRVLRALIASMAEHIEKQQVRLDAALAEKAAKDQAAFVLEEKVKLLRRDLFGKKSEIREASDRPRDKSQQAALISSQATFPAPALRAQKGKSKGKELEEQIFDHHPSEEDFIDEGKLRGFTSPSKDQWVDTGLFEGMSLDQLKLVG